MFLLTFTSLFIILFPGDTRAHEWQCNDLLNQCINDTDNFLTISAISSSNIDYFCDNYTQFIIPCLANEMKENPGSTHLERFTILHKCIHNGQSKKNDSEITVNLTKILRLYLYGCIYGNMADMIQSSCFNKLIQHCVEGIPTAERCHYWNCKSEHFLNVKAPNLKTKFQKNEEENTVEYYGGKWQRNKVRISSDSAIPNCQGMKREFIIYLIISLFHFSSLFLQLKFI